MRNALAKFEHELLEKSSIEDALECIATWSKHIIVVERCSFFIYDEKEHRLRTLWADGSLEIELPSNLGIAGESFRTQKALYENDPYDDLHFLSDIDMQTGYYTQNILAAPLRNRDDEVFGVLELLNKKGDFNKKDLEKIQQITQIISRYFT